MHLWLIVVVLVKAEDEGWNEYVKEFETEDLDSQAKIDFDDFDVNGDGQLDAAEIRSKFAGYLDERDMYHFYDEADSDHSGTVNREEYYRYVRINREDERVNV